MKDKLIDLIRNAPKIEFPSGSRAQGRTYQTSANLADYLIANGVVILDPKKYPPVTNRDMLDTIMGVPLDEMAAMIEEKKKGERKQTELVRKIFTEIDKVIDKHHSDCNEYEDGDEHDTAITYIAYISCDIDDLYQKYMEGADDEKQKMS